MAKEQVKKLGIFIAGVGLFISILGGMFGLVWAGSRKFTTVEKDMEIHRTEATTGIKSVADNQSEDRVNIKSIADLVSEIQQTHEDDYKELKQDGNDAKLRDERQSTQYQAILGHMTEQTTMGKRFGQDISDMRLDIGKMQTKMETLTKDK